MTILKSCKSWIWRQNVVETLISLVREVLLKGKGQYLLVITSLERLLFIWEHYLPFNKTSYLNEEVKRTEPSLKWVFSGLELYFRKHFFNQKWVIYKFRNYLNLKMKN